jgi:4-carboxymuconolactone decarboxylase
MYLPEIFKQFMDEFPGIADATRKAGELASNAGPLDGKTQHLIQLGICVGTASKGGVRSHARRALEAGATKEEVLQTVLLSTSSIGFPTMIASYGWVKEVLAAHGKE